MYVRHFLIAKVTLQSPMFISNHHNHHTCILSELQKTGSSGKRKRILKHTVVANRTFSGLKPSISPSNVALNANLGTVLKTACPEDSKTTRFQMRQHWKGVRIYFLGCSTHDHCQVNKHQIKANSNTFFIQSIILFKNFQR